MTDGMMFDVPEGKSEPAAEGEGSGSRARVRRPDRMQMSWQSVHLDGLLPPEHRARAVWAFVERLDLSALYSKVKAVEGHQGQPAIDPAILLALWLYATVEGVGSARAVARLTQEHVAYRWLCGGVGVNHHALSDFRVAHGEVLDRLLTQSVAVLMDQGVVELQRVAQDGIRVRASAGASSFRRRSRLEGFLVEAGEQVGRLKKELEDDPAATTRREEAARKRAAEERQARVEEALLELADLEEKKRAEIEEGRRAERRDEGKLRASTTDRDARRMKMADGGFRPAFNVQLATDTKSQVIVGVDVSNKGTDGGAMPPMLDQIEQRHGRRPREVLVDGGFAMRKDIEAVSRGGKPCVVYAPVLKPRDPTRDPHVPQQGDSEEIAAWRIRMGTTEAKEIYKERASTAECVNALARNRGLRQFLVRGLKKVKAVALLFALAHNMMRAWAFPPRTALAS